MCEASEVMEDEELAHHLDKPLLSVDFRVLPSKERSEESKKTMEKKGKLEDCFRVEKSNCLPRG